jgi:hypothetical protein
VPASGTSQAARHNRGQQRRPSQAAAGLRLQRRRNSSASRLRVARQGQTLNPEKTAHRLTMSLAASGTHSSSDTSAALTPASSSGRPSTPRRRRTPVRATCGRSRFQGLGLKVLANSLQERWLPPPEDKRK